MKPFKLDQSIIKHKYGVGTTHKNNMGEEFEIIENVNPERRRIKFLDGIEIEVPVCSIRIGSIYHPNKFQKYGVGTIFKTHEGYDIEVIEKLKNDMRKIKFLDEYGYEKLVSKYTIIQTFIKNPYHKSVCGVGYYGVGEYIGKLGDIKNRYYATWRSMLERCYSEKASIRLPTYKNVTVCEEWLNFQNFAKWHEENYPYEIEGVKFSLDKDLLQEGIENKIYSPETCLFLPQKVNGFIANRTLKNKSGYTGVSLDKKSKKWIASINDYKLEKTIYLGSFLNIEDASFQYLEYRKLNAECIKEDLRKLNYLSEEVIQLIK